MARGSFGWLVLAVVSAVVACAQSGGRPASADATEQQRVILVQAYKQGLSGVHAANPKVKLSLGRDVALPEEPVLLVDYPEPSDDPAGRDVWCDAENRNWTGGHAISFQVKPTAAVKLSVSFLDRNRVAYTAWVELQGGAWQPVNISFDEIRPNPYFQPPDAKTGAPMDLSDVKAVAFAPHDQTSGHLALSKLVVVK